MLYIQHSSLTILQVKFSDLVQGLQLLKGPGLKPEFQIPWSLHNTLLPTQNTGSQTGGAPEHRIEKRLGSFLAMLGIFLPRFWDQPLESESQGPHLL